MGKVPKISFYEVSPERKDPYRAENGLRHPLFAWLGWRPIFAQHTRAEHEALRRTAEGRRALVEIGVAEGASAVAMRETMSPDGTLFLIDPYHLSRFPLLNALRRAAHRAVDACPRGTATWIQKFSHEVSPTWKVPIDLLLIDGDHQEQSVWRDWNEWKKFVAQGGVVLFHDARLFEAGWTTREYGPVRVVEALFRKAGAAKWHIIDEVDSLVIVERRA